MSSRAPTKLSAAHETSWIERAEATLTAAAHRRGGARRALLELLQAQECALSAQEIEDSLRGEALRLRGAARGGNPERKIDRAPARPVSRASVYRILDELERLKLVQRVDTGQSNVRYERTGEHGHHHHFVCDDCGRLQPFSDEALERAIEQLADRVPLTVTEHEVLLHGACQDCA